MNPEQNREAGALQASDEELYLRFLRYLPWLVAILYLLVPAYHPGYDALLYQQAIDAGALGYGPLWKPSHVLYGPLGLAGVRLSDVLGSGLAASPVFTLLGTAAAAATLKMLRSILRDEEAGAVQIAALLTMLAGSYVLWQCATSPDLAKNVLALVPLLGVLRLLQTAPEQASAGRFLVVGFLGGAAVLFHMLAVLAVPALLLYLYLRTGRVRSLSLGMAAGIATVLFGYSVAWSLQDPAVTEAGFLTWFGGSGGNAWWQFSIPRMVFDTGLTAVRSLFGAVTYEGLRVGLSRPLGPHLQDLVLAAVALGVFAGLLRDVLRRLVRNGSPSEDPLGACCVLWILPYLLFAMMFDPGNVRMFLFPVVPLVILLGGDRSHDLMDRRRGIRILNLALMVLFLNLGSVMIGEVDRASQPAYDLLDRAAGLSPSSADLLLMPSAAAVMYASYYGGYRALMYPRTPEQVQTSLAALMQTRQGGGRLLIPRETVLQHEKLAERERDPAWAVITSLFGAPGSSPTRLGYFRLPRRNGRDR